MQLTMYHRFFNAYDFISEPRQITDLVAAAHTGNDHVFVAQPFQQCFITDRLIIRGSAKQKALLRCGLA